MFRMWNYCTGLIDPFALAQLGTKIELTAYHFINYLLGTIIRNYLLLGTIIY